MTPYIALELFLDFEAEDRIAVEGFDSTDSMAEFLLFSAPELFPGWRTTRAATHDDVREVLSMLDTIEATARFLVNLGYDDTEIRTTLARDFPGENAEVAMSAAYEHKRRLDAEVEALATREDQAAVAAEHDLGRTMHNAD
jgi:hypothetical protein